MEGWKLFLLGIMVALTPSLLVLGLLLKGTSKKSEESDDENYHNPLE